MQRVLCEAEVEKQHFGEHAPLLHPAAAALIADSEVRNGIDPLEIPVSH